MNNTAFGFRHYLSQLFNLGLTLLPTIACKTPAEYLLDSFQIGSNNRPHLVQCFMSEYTV